MTINYLIQPGDALRGQLRVPGDKSISHRALMLGAIAQGVTHIQGFLAGQDTVATLKVLQAMGVEIERSMATEVMVHGVGLRGLQAPQATLDCGNSGTSMRLLTGLLAAQNFSTTLVGDSSLNRRPMQRVVTPLTQMGAHITTAEHGYPPVKIFPVSQLHSIEYAMPVASAQVKSAILLAALFATGKTRVIEPATTRDHTERMLQAFAYPIDVTGNCISISGNGVLMATEITVPADISSAAFFLVAASITPNSDITLLDVGVNPTRTGVIDILRLMGADILLHNKRMFGGEPVADIQVRSAKLHGINIPENLVPLAIDEFPVLFIAAANAEGETVLTGAAELRVKESDRIQVMADGLKILGIHAEPTSDGMRIRGGKYGGGTIMTHGDHRIAMAFTIAGINAQAPIKITDCDNVATSFPDFLALAQSVGINIIASI